MPLWASPSCRCADVTSATQEEKGRFTGPPQRLQTKCRTQLEATAQQGAAKQFLLVFAIHTVLPDCIFHHAQCWRLGSDCWLADNFSIAPAADRRSPYPYRLHQVELSCYNVTGSVSSPGKLPWATAACLLCLRAVGKSAGHDTGLSTVQ